MSMSSVRSWKLSTASNGRHIPDGPNNNASSSIQAEQDVTAFYVCDSTLSFQNSFMTRYELTSREPSFANKFRGAVHFAFVFAFAFAFAFSSASVNLTGAPKPRIKRGT